MDLSELVNLIANIVALASLVASMTPTPKDDRAVSKLVKLIDMLALNIGKAKRK